VTRKRNDVLNETEMTRIRCAAALVAALGMSAINPSAAWGDPAAWSPEIRIGDESPVGKAELPTSPPKRSAPVSDSAKSGNAKPPAAVDPDRASSSANADERKPPATTPVMTPTAQISPPVDESRATDGTAAKATGAAEAVANQDSEKRSSTDPAQRGGRTLVEKYCDVVVDPALAAKLAQERSEAKKLQKDIEDKLQELKVAIDEHEKWLKLRNDFQNKATDNLVTVYSQMDSEAAAQRLTAVGDQIASAILLKLPPKSASAILGEMPSDVAGRLTAFMAGAAELNAQDPAPSPGATQ